MARYALEPSLPPPMHLVRVFPPEPLLLSLYCKIWSEKTYLHENTEYSSHFTIKNG